MKKTILTLCFSTLFANPTLPHVDHGTVMTSAMGNMLQVTASDKAVITWRDFSIAMGETTQFILPSSSAWVLNKVSGGDLSLIQGNLTANGNVILLNQHGILIGPSGVIDVGGFLASTLLINDLDFINHRETRHVGISSCSIINNGTITANTGDAILIGAHVENNGTITAPMGLVALAEGQYVVINPAGPDRVTIIPSLRFHSSLISNEGKLSGREVVLRSQGSPYALAIHAGGEIEATAISNEGGRVLLISDEGMLDVDGIIHATGDIVLNAPAVHVKEQGEIFSNQSDVILSSQDATWMYGAIEGSFVEISSQGALRFPGKITSYEKLFIDPSEIIINGGPTNPAPFTDSYDPIVSGISFIDSADIQTALGAGNDVEISTANGTNGSGDITWLSGFPISWGTGASLALKAAEEGNITLLSDIDNSAGTGNISFEAGGNIQIGMLGSTATTIIAAGNSCNASAQKKFIMLEDAFNVHFQGNDRFNIYAQDAVMISGTNGGQALANGLGSNLGTSSITTRNLTLSGNSSDVQLFVPNSLLNISVWNDFSVEQLGASTTFVLCKDASIQIGNDLSVANYFDGATAIVGVNSLDLQVGNDLFLNQLGTNLVSSQSFIISGFFAGTVGTNMIRIGGSIIGNNAISVGQGSGIGGFEKVDIEAGKDIIYQNGLLFATGVGTILVKANRNLIMGSNCLAAYIPSAPVPILPDASVTFVVDNRYPKAPHIGEGQFFMDGSSAILSNIIGPQPDVPVKIFTARRSQNFIFGQLPQNSSFVPGPLNVDSLSEQWGIYFPYNLFGIPFTIFYKEPQINAQDFNTIAQVYGNAFDFLSYMDETLIPWNYEACCTPPSGEKLCYPIRTETERKSVRKPEY